MNKTLKNKNLLLNILLFILILLFSSVFRITNLDLIEFKTDEALNVLLALRVLSGYPLPPGGTVSSIGILNPPLFIYTLIPLTFLSSDPRAISFFIGLFNTLAIAFLYAVIRHYYGKTVAIITGILLAFSPWAIIFSRKIWNQDFLIPFFAPLFYSLHKLVIDKKDIFWIPYISFSLFLIQLHQTTIIFIAPLTLLILLKKVKINYRYLILGAIIGLIPLIPYIFYEIKNGCLDCKSLIETKGRLTNYSKEIFFRPFQIVGFGNLRFLIGDDTLTLKQNYPILDNIRKILYLNYLLLPVGFFLFIRKFKNLNFLAFTVLLLPFIYFFLKFNPFMHYFIILIPLLFLFIGVALSHLLSQKKTLIKFCGLFLLILITTASISSNIALFSLLKNKGAVGGDLGSVYIVLEHNIKENLKDLEKKSDYKEIFFSAYIPFDYIFGYLPLGKILYGDVKDSDLPKLEEQLKKTPQDPRISHKIFAYYTRSFLTLGTLDILTKKKNEIPQYETIYNHARDEYLLKNYKKEYASTTIKIRFFYPRHCIIKDLRKEVLVNCNEYIISVKAEKNEIKVSCLHSESRCNMGVVEDIKKSIKLTRI